MDVLSDVVVAMRAGRPHANRVQHRSPFRRAFPAADSAGMHVVLQGSCRLTTPGAEPVVLAAGDVAFLPRGSAHELADCDTDTELMCGAYLVDRGRPHPLLTELPDLIHLSARAGRHPALRSTIGLLDLEVHEARPGADAMVPALLDVLFLHVLRAWLDEQDAAAGWVAAVRDPAVGAALSAVHREPARPWTVAALAGEAGLSRAAFARRFAGLVGQPPLTYLTWWRMTLAARVLRDTDTSLAGVARQVGYGSEFAFAHAFKRQFGQPPGQFRRDR